MRTAQIGPDLRLSESFFFFHKHGVMGSSFNVLTQSLAVLGQPMQNFTEPLFRHILEHQDAPALEHLFRPPSRLRGTQGLDHVLLGSSFQLFFGLFFPD